MLLGLRPLALLGALCLTACHSTMPTPSPAVLVPGASSAMLQLGAGNRVAHLSLSAPQAPYSLQAAPTVHRWVAEDIVRYEVELLHRTGTAPEQFSSFSTPVLLVVPSAGSQAVGASFGQLSQGVCYRAMVKAVGREGGVGGSGPLQVLNTQASDDFADFDFTASNDVDSQPQRSVRIDFDAVAFSGTGGLGFSTPAPGSFINPVADPIATVSNP